MEVKLQRCRWNLNNIVFNLRIRFLSMSALILFSTVENMKNVTDD